MEEKKSLGKKNYVLHALLKEVKLITNSLLNFCSRIASGHLLPGHVQRAGKFFLF